MVDQTNDDIIDDINKRISNLKDILKTYDILRAILPDIRIKWDNDGKMGFYSDTVDTDYDEISIYRCGGCCGSVTHYARSIKFVKDIRVRGTLLVIGHRYRGHGENYDYLYDHPEGTEPEEDWKEKTKIWGDRGIKIIQKYLDKDPPKDIDIIDEDDENDEVM